MEIRFTVKGKEDYRKTILKLLMVLRYVENWRNKLL